MSSAATVKPEVYLALKKEYDQFNYIISHDLSAPLRHIEQFSGLLIESLSEHMGEEQRVFSDYIQQSVVRSQSMLDSLLKLSRITTEEEQFGQNKIDEMLDTVMESFPDVNVERNVQQLNYIYCDHHLMINLFTLLIENSVKFKQADRVLRITIDADVINQDLCVIKVSDNGIGIANKREDVIFEPFQRLHATEEYEGAGMGLTYCRKIVNLHSGTIYCSSIENQGCSFSITLPTRNQSIVAA